MSIHPDAISNPQKGSQGLETTHGSGGLTEIGSSEKGGRHPPQTIKHLQPQLTLTLRQLYRVSHGWSANPFAPCPIPESGIPVTRRATEYALSPSRRYLREPEPRRSARRR